MIQCKHDNIEIVLIPKLLEGYRICEDCGKKLNEFKYKPSDFW